MGTCGHSACRWAPGAPCALPHVRVGFRAAASEQAAAVAGAPAEEGGGSCGEGGRTHRLAGEAQLHAVRATRALTFRLCPLLARQDLAAGQEVVAFDFPGQGFSWEVELPQQVTVADVAEATMEFFDLLGLDKPNIMVSVNSL